MTGIEFVEPMPALQPDLVECLKTAGDRNPGARSLDAQSMPQPRRLPDGRRYIVIGGVAAQRDVYAELKDYPDETAITYVGEELRRLACKQGADAILRAGVTCGPCPDRDTVPCVFAHGSFIVWVSTQPNE